MSPDRRARGRFEGLVRLRAQSELLQLQIRQQVAALAQEDTAFGLRSFVSDELAMTFAESTGTSGRLVDDALMTASCPRVMALVEASARAALDPEQPMTLGWFGMRHADAVLGELAGASDAVQEQVLDVVLGRAEELAVQTPYQLRQAVKAARLLLDLEADRDKQDRIHERRGVSLLDESDGSCSLHVSGLKTKGAEMLAAIDAQPGVGVAEPGDERNLGQRRYDYLLALLRGEVSPTAPWQAFIVVSLETLEGGDAPAEIPGLGLVSAAEAREVCAQADLRRAVVDSSGRLVALDDAVLRGDQVPLGPAPRDPARHELEPALVDAAPPTASAEEWAWLAEQESDDPAADEHGAALAEHREARLMRLCDDGVERLEELLRDAARSHRQHAAAVVGWRSVVGAPGVWAPSGRDRPPPGPDDNDDPPSGGSRPPRPGPARPGGDGCGSPPSRPPTYDRHDPPPSRADSEWLAWQEDAAGAHPRLDDAAWSISGAALPAPRSFRGAPTALAQQRAQERVERQARASRWTTDRLRAAVTTLRTAPPAPLPSASSGYLFRGRLARWIKARDVTCTFPGCTRLAQRCQLDHVVAYPAGPTAHANGACECVHHHQAKHAVMAVSRRPDGTMVWTNRFGVTRVRPPRSLLRGW